MTTLYLADVIGTGTRADPWRVPDALNNSDWVQLYVDTISPKKPTRNNTRKAALGVHPSNTITGPGIRLLKSAANGPALVTALQTSAPSGAERNFLNGYTDGAELTRVPTSTWWAALTAPEPTPGLLTQVEPALDVEQAILSAG